MSTAQKIASERFLEAMGPMVNEEQNVARVVKFITLMKQEECPTISDEEFSLLIPAEEMFTDLKQMVHNFYKKEVIA